MNSMTQLDHHPDADVLNAFAEHALPEAERARVVAHMAGCVRCREVVFLAQAAAQPEIAPQIAPWAAPVSAAKAEPRPGWFSAAFAKWRVALIPVAALATVGGIVLWVQLHPVMQDTQMAKSATPTTVPSSPAAPVPLDERRAEPPAGNDQKAAAAPKESPVVASSRQGEHAPAHQQKKAPAPAAGIVAMNQLTPSDAANAPALAGSGGRGRAVGGFHLDGRHLDRRHLDGRSAAMAQYAPPPQPLASPSIAAFSAPPPGPQAHPGPQGQQPSVQAPRNTSQQPAVTVDSAAVPMAPAPAPAPPNIVAVHGSAIGAGAGISPLSAPSSPTAELAPQPMNGLAVMRLARRVKLPSGLNTVSSAALLNRLVAIDSAGGVFHSQDGGKHWEAVPPHWTGKAVEVQAPAHALFTSMPDTKAHQELTTIFAPAPVAGAPEESPAAPPPPPSAGANAAPSPARLKAKAKAAPPVLPVQFKLVTDHREVWVSADGKVWREQQ